MLLNIRGMAYRPRWPMEPLVFDTIHVESVEFVGLSHGCSRHQYRVCVRRELDTEEPEAATFRAHMTDWGIGRAMLPVEQWIAQRVAAIAGCRNDGRKLERLLARVASDGGSLYICEPADQQDFGQPIEPRPILPAGFR